MNCIRIVSGPATTADVLQTLTSAGLFYDRADGYRVVRCPSPEAREAAMVKLRKAGHTVEPGEVEREPAQKESARGAEIVALTAPLEVVR
jgi:hypothetical protein